MKKQSARSVVAIATSIAHFANDVPVTLLPAVLPLLIKEFDLSYAAAGAAITASALLMTSLQAVTGYVADRWNMIRLLFFGLTTLGIGTILIGFSTSYVQILAFGCLMGIGGSAFHPIGYALLSGTFESGNRGKALGLGSAAGDIAVPVAFATSGFLAPALGWRTLFISWGIIAIVAAAVVPLIIKKPRTRSFHSTATDRSTVATVRTLIPVFVVMGLVAATYKIAASFITTHLHESFELSIESANFVFALMMVVGTVGSVVGGTLVDRFGEKSTVTAEVAALGVLSLVSVYIRDVYLLSGVICMIGFFMLGVWPSFYSVIANVTSLRARAFMYGILFAVAWSFGSFFPYISGVFADIFGLHVIYVLIGGLSLVAAFIAYSTFKKYDYVRKP